MLVYLNYETVWLLEYCLDKKLIVGYDILSPLTIKIRFTRGLYCPDYSHSPFLDFSSYVYKKTEIKLHFTYSVLKTCFQECPDDEFIFYTCEGLMTRSEIILRAHVFIEDVFLCAHFKKFSFRVICD